MLVEHVEVVEARLQVHVALLARQGKVRMGERDALEREVAHLVGGAFPLDGDQRLQAWGDHQALGHILPFPSLVVEHVLRFIQVPLPFLVDELVGVLEVEALLAGRVAHEGGAQHRVFAAPDHRVLRLLHLYLADIALVGDLAQAQDGLRPSDHQVHLHFVQLVPNTHLVAVDLEALAERVYLSQAEEVMVAVLLQVRIAGSDSLLTVHVELTETGFHVRSGPDIVFSVMQGPTLDRDATRHQRRLARIVPVTDVVARLASV